MHVQYIYLYKTNKIYMPASTFTYCIHLNNKIFIYELNKIEGVFYSPLNVV